MTKDWPLAGLNLVVTRPQEQAAALLQGIKDLGGNGIAFPLLEINPLLDDAPLRELSARLAEFQLAIFISPNAVRFGMEAIQNSGGLPLALKVATVGMSSANALRDLGVQNIITPRHRFDSEALLEMPELQQVRGMHVVIFRGDSGRELLGDTLKLRGATIEYASCYRRQKPRQNIEALFSAQPDAVCVSSSEAVHNLWQMLSPPHKEWFTALPLFVSHQRIAMAARQLGWQNVMTAGGGDEGLLSELVNWAEHKKGKNNE